MIDEALGRQLFGIWASGSSETKHRSVWLTKMRRKGRDSGGEFPSEPKDCGKTGAGKPYFFNTRFTVFPVFF